MALINDTSTGVSERLAQATANEALIRRLRTVWARKNTHELREVIGLFQLHRAGAEIVRGSLEILRAMPPGELPENLVHFARHHLLPQVTVRDALLVAYMLSRAAKSPALTLRGGPHRFYLLKYACLWAAMVMGAHGGWDVDDDGRPVWQTGAAHCGYKRFHGDEDGELRATLGEFAAYSAASLPRRRFALVIPDALGR